MSKSALRRYLVFACAGVPVRVCPSVPARRAAARARRLAATATWLRSAGYLA